MRTPPKKFASGKGFENINKIFGKIFVWICDCNWKATCYREGKFNEKCCTHSKMMTALTELVLLENGRITYNHGWKTQISVETIIGLIVKCNSKKL